LRRYEGMFVFDSATVQDWPALEAEVRRLCDRIQAKLEVCLKFDDRKLAYEIKGRKRGTYVLTYFDADPARIPDLERDAQLSDAILRALVLRADDLSADQLATLKKHPADQPLAPALGDGRRGEGEGPRHRPRAEDEPALEQPLAAEEPAEAGADLTEEPIRPDERRRRPRTENRSDEQRS